MRATPDGPSPGACTGLPPARGGLPDTDGSPGVGLIIVDTNVLLAGLPTANGPGTAAAILDGMLDGSIAFVVSDALLSEYRAVLMRPPLLARFRLAPADAEALVERLARIGIRTCPVPARPAPDPGDQMLWELLAACPEARLVTRDGLLLRKGRMRRRIVLPEALGVAPVPGPTPGPRPSDPEDGPPGPRTRAPA